MDVVKLSEAISLWLSAYSLKLVAAILMVILGRWLARRLTGLLARFLEHKKVDLTLVRFFDGIAYYSLLVLVLIAAAEQLGINTTSFLAVIGAAGLAVGLALKDSLANFASGVMLVLFRPFRVGDAVTAGGVTGKVEHIDIFNTVITTPDNQRIIIPNVSITSDVITNINANPTRRIDLTIGIGYTDDLTRAKKILMDIVAADGRILSDPAPQVAVSELADSCVNLVVRPWVDTGDYWDVRLDLIEKIKTTFDREGISIPYPQQDVHLYPEPQSRD
jgi:small conductance mechanosensitive channel